MNLIKYIKNIPKEVHVFDLLLKKTVQKKFDFWISHELDKVHKIWIPNEVHVLRFASANGWSKIMEKKLLKMAGQKKIQHFLEKKFYSNDSNV